MRHLMAFTFVALAGLGCDEKPTHEAPITAERSQAVQGPATTAATTAVTPVTASAAPASPPKARRALCGGKLDAEGKALPVKKPVGRRNAPGAAELPAELALAGFTWVNFWAAWCVPCKEEIPRLLSFQERLRAQGKAFKVTFVSLDDDERQLMSFLAAQPPAGLRSTYWLHEGKEREDWLSAAGVDSDPDLPQHLLVDAKGKVRCRVKGAVEDADFDGLAALLGGS
ncbi:MAG TPA: TlpA disulfide reductase family protein [Polyangiaceae bacterium]|nr:TlpA disulfide reductase family protein [Polyangiaceae bacterium]